MENSTYGAVLIKSAACYDTEPQDGLLDPAASSTAVEGSVDQSLRRDHGRITVDIGICNQLQP